VKVLAVSSFWHPRGGDTTCLFGMVDALGAAGHEVIPFAMRHPDNLPSVWETRWPPALEVFGTAPLTQVLRVPEAIWSGRAARALESLLREVRPDVAHIHHLHRHLTPSILEPLRRHGVPIVWTVHDYELICPNAHLYAQGAYCDRCKGHRYEAAVELRCRRDDLPQSVAVALEKWVHWKRDVWDRVDRFLCPSRFLLERLAEFGVPRDRLVHHPNFVDDRPPAPGSGEGWMYAGRLATEKGVDDLLAAARLLPDVPLTVAGDGPERLRLERAAPPWVHFLGQVPPAEVARLLDRARVVAVPSRWPENDPYAVLEAQMAGRPVVATAVGGMVEQIRSGVDGVLVPAKSPAALARAVRELLGDTAECAVIGTAARARVRFERNRVDWLRSLEHTYALLV
jgi:glycosyltransferase involved in cell wall biosynthesis